MAVAAFVLHRWPYQESSLLCDLLTEDQGRVRVIAKGARRPKSQWRSILQPFVPLQVAFQGRRDLQTLTQAESSRGAVPLVGVQLYSAFYINELVQRLTGAHNHIDGLFDDYQQTLALLSESTEVEPCLRHFEWRLLCHLGLAFDWQHDHLTGEALTPGTMVQFQAGSGFTLAPAQLHQNGRDALFASNDILQLAEFTLPEARLLPVFKRLMRLALAPYLGDQPLRSRSLFKFTQRETDHGQPESDTARR